MYDERCTMYDVRGRTLYISHRTPYIVHRTFRLAWYFQDNFSACCFAFFIF
jgi:hypothetical protein